MMKKRWLSVTALIFFAVVARFLPHVPNFSPIVAIALFAGAYFSNRLHVILVPLAALFLTDLFLGFYPEMPIVYGSMALIALMGTKWKANESVLNFAGVSLASSVVFFVLTNLGVWAIGHIYPLTTAGLTDCFVMAIPFFRNTVVSTFVFGTVLIGTQEFLNRRILTASESRA